MHDLCDILLVGLAVSLWCLARALFQRRWRRFLVFLGCVLTILLAIVLLLRSLGGAIRGAEQLAAMRKGSTTPFSQPRPRTGKE